MRLSSYVKTTKEHVNGIAGDFWFAYFMGTNNRVKRNTGEIVQGYTKRSDLMFDLKNNPMERGVVI